RPQTSKRVEPEPGPTAVPEPEPMPVPAPTPAPVDYREYLEVRLELAPGAMDGEPYRHFNISGTIANGGYRPVKDVSINVVLYGANGRPIHSISFIPGWYIEEPVVQPGATVGFTGWIMYEATLSPSEFRGVVNRYSFAD
ncbi:MAG: hypothetical protein JXB46_00995, partial [Candidatus Eisenbacteria bacterium]|nr:hypothetical protein [Candidatus Eisenbacteria bacterium]